MSDDDRQPACNPTLMSRDEKLARMRARIADLGSVAVAFSAGVDSTFVLKVAADVLGPQHVLAVTARSPSVPAAEVAEARGLAEWLGVEHAIIDTHEFSNPNYTANPTDRCYYCKTALYTHMQYVVRERGILAIISGTNYDDLGDWRPGLRAAGERAVVAPAAEAGLTKADIRALSSAWGLPTSAKPASPCLSSRVPYGQAVTPEKLRMIEAGEAFLKQRFGLRECRVRHYGTFARIEAPPAEVAALESALAEIAAHFRALGFSTTEIDPRGFRSGALNEVIAFGARQGAGQHSTEMRR
jgi:uncharacterized protein